MAEPFLSEIRLMSFNFPPQGWALCNGQFLPINQNQALFSLLGTTYGGNGQTTFALPDLRGRVPIHMGGGFTLGQTGGQEAHTVTVGELPAHTHAVRVSATSTGGTASPAGAYLGGANNAYRSGPASTSLNPASVTSVGGSQPHENRQPFLTLSFCIALQGIFPSQT
ncbi:tail fiber protein [Nocardioides sp. QY071]|uniref:phage tail protein n=1 Tax=Nocardioides sp. QY071 TaxID=3044187 RepID=UPI00249BC993|nr:tail fiber protein [Nocardioides sp. QY071]WGY03958.1 tail fiber protein [Nocardioides sp. QY071]